MTLQKTDLGPESLSIQISPLFLNFLYSAKALTRSVENKAGGNMIGSDYTSLSRLLSRRLIEISRSSSDSLQRLATGKRILRPSDDPANFSLLTRVDAQVRGLRQASLNVNQVQGLTATAESALSSMSDLTLKLRDLALQAADSSLTTSERSLLADEASELLAEFNQIAEATSFGSQNLLTGNINDYYVQTGYDAGQGFSFSIGDARASSLGKIAIYSGVQGSISQAIGSGASYVLSINGISIGASTDDGVSTANADESGIAAANAINAKSSQTGVYAEALATERTLYIDSFGGTYTGTFDEDDFLINGVSITGTIADAGDLISAINDKSSSTGVTASIDGNGDIVFTADDGRNIEIDISNSTTNNVFDVFDITENASFFGGSVATLSSGANAAHGGAIQIYSSKAISITGGASLSQAIGLSDGLKSLVSGTSTSNISLLTESDADEAVKILDATLEDISRLRAEVGAVHSRLDISSTYILSQQIELETVQEDLGGADIALELANIAVQQMLQDATLTSLTQANTSYSMVSRLLGDSLG